MPTMASIVGNDPLARLIAARRGTDQRPIPLVATHIAVKIRGGLASVTTERTYRNAEPQPIEATMTFPVPVDATLCALSACIDGRRLTASAQPQQKARETYEQAIDQGKAAVLHEELLKGVHMVSVANVRPGADIVVSDTWTAALSFVDGVPRLRIPTSIGEIYGRSPLSPPDDLIAGDTVHEATIRIVCEDGTATLLRAGAVTDGGYSITLDQPIDITVAGWTKRTLSGIAADGRSVTLDIEPALAADTSLDISLLVDHSGSMNEQAVADDETPLTKFLVAKAGLVAVTRNRLKDSDRIHLWEFNDSVRSVGEATGTDCTALIDDLQQPYGGTEIGSALTAAITSKSSRNVVIVTDGKSWALDAQTLARTGMRLTAILIGDDALDATISHLAGMTGGQSFVAAGSDAAAAIGTAIEAARAPFRARASIDGAPMRIEALRRGARLVVTWSTVSDSGHAREAATADEREVAATAAMLAIPAMTEAEATALAVSEGIVCHLTSLVLVDEAGARHEGLPAPRKVALSLARAVAAPMAGSQSYAPARMLCVEAGLSRGLDRRSFHIGGSAPPPAATAPSHQPHVESIASAAPPLCPPRVDLGGMAARIDWEADPDAFRRGDLSALAPRIAQAVRVAAALPEIEALARKLGLDALVLVIALLARTAASSRSAQRIARATLKQAQAADIEDALKEIGL
jgi:Vault protein inter-alpha-trypsin domain/von Willebrand factor type A domain